MAASLAEQRAALERWLADGDVRELLERKEWRAAFANYPRLDLRDQPVPWSTAPRDLTSSRITLVSSSGLYTRDQQPYDADAPYGDYTYRAIPANLDLATAGLAHAHYDHTAADQDRNVVFPLERLRELARKGALGGLTEQHFSVMGYMPDWRNVLDGLAPEVARLVAAQQPDAAILVPV